MSRNKKNMHQKNLFRTHSAADAGRQVESQSDTYGKLNRKREAIKTFRCIPGLNVHSQFVCSKRRVCVEDLLYINNLQLRNLSSPLLFCFFFLFLFFFFFFLFFLYLLLQTFKKTFKATIFELNIYIFQMRTSTESQKYCYFVYKK